jgi:hypothetical protein
MSPATGSSMMGCRLQYLLTSLQSAFSTTPVFWRPIWPLCSVGRFLHQPISHRNGAAFPATAPEAASCRRPLQLRTRLHGGRQVNANSWVSLSSETPLHGTAAEKYGLTWAASGGPREKQPTLTSSLLQHYGRQFRSLEQNTIERDK